MTYQYEEMDKRYLYEAISKGYLPEGTTLDEYHEWVNQQVDRARGK